VREHLTNAACGDTQTPIATTTRPLL